VGCCVLVPKDGFAVLDSFNIFGCQIYVFDWVVCYLPSAYQTEVYVVFGSLGQVVVQMVVARELLTVGAKVHNLAFLPVGIVVKMGHGDDSFLHRLAAQSAVETEVVLALKLLFVFFFSHVGLLGLIT
jgi:hypothetical protein